MKAVGHEPMPFLVSVDWMRTQGHSLSEHSHHDLALCQDKRNLVGGPSCWTAPA